MMYEPEKSDSVVVAMKPVNKAERSAAEPVEPRTETKGNADQHRTRRAQDRESVSQALERVRLAARRGKQERFTSLLHHMTRCAAQVRGGLKAIIDRRLRPCLAEPRSGRRNGSRNRTKE